MKKEDVYKSFHDFLWSQEKETGIDVYGLAIGLAGFCAVLAKSLVDLDGKVFERKVSIFLRGYWSWGMCFLG